MSRPRVLVFEPGSEGLRAIAPALEAADFDVLPMPVSSHAGWEEALSSQRPDFALLGTCGADEDGAAIARQLRSTGVPFVVMAAHGGHSAEEALAAGAMGFFVKPFDVRLIIPSIPIWIARAAEAEHLRGNQESMLEALRSNRAIGAAVGVLIERHGLTADDAFDALRRQARHERQRIVTLASAIVSGAARPSVVSPPARQANAGPIPPW
jgi:two-component system, response regulator PdtaR